MLNGSPSLQNSIGGFRRGLLTTQISSGLAVIHPVQIITRSLRHDADKPVHGVRGKMRFQSVSDQVPIEQLTRRVEQQKSMKRSIPRGVFSDAILGGRLAVGKLQSEGVL